MYDFANNVVEDDRYYYAFDDIPQRFGHDMNKDAKGEHEIGKLLLKTTLWWKPHIIYTSSYIPEVLMDYIKATGVYYQMVSCPPYSADQYDLYSSPPSDQRFLFVVKDHEECLSLFARGLPKTPVCLFLWNIRNPSIQTQGMPSMPNALLYIDLYNWGVLISGPDIIRTQTINVIAARQKPFRLGWI